MKSNAKKINGRSISRLALIIMALGTGAAALWGPFNSKAAVATGSDMLKSMYRRPAPQFDFNISRGLPNVRQATGAQTLALNNLKASANASNMTARWNDFGGSPDVMYDFASPSYAGTPEEAARAFVNQNAGLFGVTEMNNFRTFSLRDALGGHL